MPGVHVRDSTHTITSTVLVLRLSATITKGAGSVRFIQGRFQETDARR